MRGPELDVRRRPAWAIAVLALHAAACVAMLVMSGLAAVRLGTVLSGGLPVWAMSVTGCFLAWAMASSLLGCAFAGLFWLHAVCTGRIGRFCEWRARRGTEIDIFFSRRIQFEHVLLVTALAFVVSCCASVVGLALGFNAWLDTANEIAVGVSVIALPAFVAAGMFCACLCGVLAVGALPSYLAHKYAMNFVSMYLEFLSATDTDSR